MKTSNILLTAFLIATFLIVGWFIVKARNHVNASFIETSGNTVSEIVEVEPFNKIKVQGKFKVNLVQRDEQRVELNADENILPEVIAEVNGRELVLRLRNNIRDQDRVTVNLQAPEVEAIEFSAGANITTNGEISGDNLYINSYAGSEGDLKVKYNSINCDSKAGSSLNISGSANNVRINSTAGSRIDASNLEANTCNIKGSAGSHIEVHANAELTADMSSGGFLQYYGEPEIKNFNTSSGGNISKK